MAQYRTGTVTTYIASGDAVTFTVLGSGTAWLTNASPGDTIIIGTDAVFYPIAAVISDTELLLAAGYPSEHAGEIYVVTRDYSPNYAIPLTNQGDRHAGDVIRSSLLRIDQLLADAFGGADFSQFYIYLESGLSIGYYGGIVYIGDVSVVIAGGFISLTDDATNYIQINAAGAVIANTTGFTIDNIPLWEIVCASGVIISSTNYRSWQIFPGTFAKKAGDETISGDWLINGEWTINGQLNFYENISMFLDHGIYAGFGDFDNINIDENTIQATDSGGVLNLNSGGGGITLDGHGIPYGNTIVVAKTGGDYDTIQGGINAASAGDTVLVYPGTYAEKIIVPSNISVVGTDSRQCKIIFSVAGDGADITKWLVRISGGELRNFYIENTYASYSSTAVGIYSGGKLIDCDLKSAGQDTLYINWGGQTSPVRVDNCRVETSVATGGVADTFSAIYCTDTIISNCVFISQNKPANFWFGNGGNGNNTVIMRDCISFSSSSNVNAAIRIWDGTPTNLIKLYLFNCQFLHYADYTPQRLVADESYGAKTTIYYQGCVFSEYGETTCAYSPIAQFGIKTYGAADLFSLKINGTTCISSSREADFTLLDVDNINVSGNTISASDSNGNLHLAGNGAGEVYSDSHLRIQTAQKLIFGDFAEPPYESKLYFSVGTLICDDDFNILCGLKVDGDLSVGGAAESGKTGTFIIPDDVILEGLTVKNTDGSIRFVNATATAHAFVAAMQLFSKGTGKNTLIEANIPVADDTGAQPVLVIACQQDDGTAIVARPLLSVCNVTTEKFGVGFQGDVLAQGFINAVAGFEDNGNVGIDGTITINAEDGAHVVVVSGGIITSWQVP